LLAAVDPECVHNAGADGAACEALAGQWNSSLIVCSSTCVAVDGTKRPGPNSGRMFAVDVTADIVQRRIDIR
jgi:hypothetical protein